MNSQDVVIIIPAYNEEATIAETVKEYVEVFPSAKIVVVDNNSKDATSERARAAIRPDRDEVIFEGRQGKGNAVRAGFSRYSADIYIMIDADLTYRAEDSLACFNDMLETRADMVVGNRLVGDAYEKQNERFGHGIGNRLLTFFVSSISGTKYKDVLSGLRVMSRAFVESQDFRSNGFQLETELNVRAAYLRAHVIERDINYASRPEGSESKLDTVRDGIRIVYFAFTNWLGLYPLYFFGPLGLLALLMSAIAGVAVVGNFLETGEVQAIATAVFAAAMGLVGVLSLFTGLTLQVLIRAMRSADIARFLGDKRRWNLNLESRKRQA